MTKLRILTFCAESKFWNATIYTKLTIHKNMCLDIYSLRKHINEVFAIAILEIVNCQVKLGPVFFPLFD